MTAKLLAGFGIALALAPSSLAQATATSETTDAFAALASDRSIRIRLSGWETFGTEDVSLAGELYWYLNFDPNTGQPIAKAEYQDFRNAILVQRAVGNGISFYNFLPLKNEYWVTTYGSNGPAQPQRYLPNLADDFTSAMKGANTYLTRLIREAYVVNGFRQWIPGGQEYLHNTLTSVPDPVVPTRRSYIATPTTEYAMFWIGSPARKSVVFEIDISNPTKRLQRVFFAERSTTGGTPRLVDWTAEIFRNFVPAQDNFVFVPPTNARIIVGPRPPSG